MPLFKIFIKISIILVILGFVGFFLSSKSISNFKIKESGVAYENNLNGGDYFLDLKCTRGSSFSYSGKLGIEIFSGAIKISSFEKNINFGRIESGKSESSTIPLENFSLFKMDHYEIKTTYKGDERVLSSCQTALSQSVPFLGLSRNNWFFVIVALVIVVVTVGLVHTVRERIGDSGRVKGEFANLREPIRIIRPRKEWGRLLVYDIFFSIPIGIVFAVFSFVVLKFMLKIDDDLSIKVMSFMFPFSFVLLMIGTYLKVVEYRFYEDRLFIHTLLVIHGGEIIFYKNIISANINSKNKTIDVRYKDEDGKEERIEIESEKDSLNENYQEVLKLFAFPNKLP